MSLNSSSSSKDSLLSSIKSSLPLGLDCLIFNPFSSIFTTFTITTILLLVPLCVLVLYHGLQRWRQHSSSSTASMTTNANTFTYHLVTMEIIWVFGCTISCCGIYGNHFPMKLVGLHLFTFTWYGETFIHVLTCVEHYLAVVHPITYLSLRKARWIRIRNIVIGFIWLLCCGGTSLISFDHIIVIVMFCVLLFSLIINSFCCLSVLCVLIRPGPGTKGRDQVRFDQSKLRAFYVILAILGVLLLRCAWNLVWSVLYVLNPGINKCVMIICEIWIDLPSTLVLPLLYLQRAGVLACCKNNMK